MYTTPHALMITTEYGKQNIYPNEPPIRIMSHNADCTEHDHSHDQWHIAEETNGRLAMIGFAAAIGSYIFTGQIIPGIF